MDFNIKDYIVAFLILILLGSLGYCWTLKMRIETLRSEFSAFVAQVDATANAQKVKNLEEKAKREGITNKLTEENEKLKTDITNKYADYKRLLNSKAGSGSMPSLSAATESLTCPAADESRLARSLDKLEAGVIERLAKSRDEAIETNLLAAEWLNQQLSVDTRIK